MAVADLFDHLHIEQRALMNTLSLQQPALLLEQRFPSFQFFLDRFNRVFQARPWHDEMAPWIHRQPVEDTNLLTCKRVKRAELLDFIAPQLDPEADVFIRGMNLDRVTANAEGPAYEIEVVTFVKDFHEFRENVAAAHPLA